MRLLKSLGCGHVLALTLTLSSVALAELPPDPGPDVEVADNAREQFKVGVALLQDPDGARYEEAYKAFMRAYAESPSWKILGNLGLCALKLERFTDGIPAYERYLKYGGDELAEAERRQIEADLRIMEATSGRVTFVVQGAEEVTIRDTRARSVGGPIHNLYEVPASGRLALALASGQHTVVARSTDGRTAEMTFDVESGASIEKVLDLAAPKSEPAAPATTTPPPASAMPPPKPAEPMPPDDGAGMRTTGYIVGGVGVAALIGGGVTALLGSNLKSDLDGRCPDGTCAYTSRDEQTTFESDVSQLETYGTMTTALLIGGGVLTAAGVTLVVLGQPASGETVRLTPALGPDVAGLMAGGSF